MIEKSACGIMEFSEDTDRERLISRNARGATEDGERDIQVIFQLPTKKEDKCSGCTQDIVSGEDQEFVKNGKEENNESK